MGVGGGGSVALARLRPREMEAGILIEMFSLNGLQIMAFRNTIDLNI